MFGKGSLLIVFGFILSISVYQRKMGEAVLSASDNFNSYYTSSLVHESALSGMNMGINKVWDQDITSDTFNVVINSCTTNVSIAEIGADTVLLKAKGWILFWRIFHINWKCQSTSGLPITRMESIGLMVIPFSGKSILIRL